MIRTRFTSVGRTNLCSPVRPAVARLSVALALAIPIAGCSEREQPVAPSSATESLTPRFTPSSGSASLLRARATFADPFSIERETGDWKMKIDSHPLDVAVQTIVFNAGSQSGWHKHPGPVFIMVVEGEIAFYESDDPTCSPIIKRAGEGYLDVGDHAHLARNETLHPARNIVTYFAPVGAALRIDAPKPGNCPF